MPALDRLHDAARNALIRDGWTITQDPLTLRTGARTLYVDLGAERLIAATKGLRKIAVEVKSLVGPSLIADLQQAVGQFAMYEDLLAEIEPERQLYLALPIEVLEVLQRDEVGALMLRRRLSRLIGFAPKTEEVVQWIP